MKRFIINTLMVVLFLMFSTLSVQANPDEKTTRLDFKLPVPESQSQKAYLGLSSQDVFSLNQVNAPILIIEIFSMYCPICQREAEDVNELFELIQSTPKLKDKVKLIGIGAGNSSFEVSFFKEKYDIQFPLFSDGDFIIHKQINEVRTPHFIGLKINPNKDIEIFYSQTGEISDPKTFIDALIKKSKKSKN